MLKFDALLILYLTLQLESDWSKPLSYMMAFLAGISISTAYELRKNRLSKRSFIIRLLQVFGLSVITFFVWQKYTIKTDYVFAIFVCSLFSDTIVSVGYKVGEMGIAGYLKHLAGNIPQDKDKVE